MQRFVVSPPDILYSSSDSSHDVGRSFSSCNFFLYLIASMIQIFLTVWRGLVPICTVGLQFYSCQIFCFPGQRVDEIAHLHYSMDWIGCWCVRWLGRCCRLNGWLELVAFGGYQTENSFLQYNFCYALSVGCIAVTLFLLTHLLMTMLHMYGS